MVPYGEGELNHINLTYVLKIKNIIRVTLYLWLNRDNGVIVQTIICFVLFLVSINVVL
jgi:hypothetical protein